MFFFLELRRQLDNLEKAANFWEAFEHTSVMWLLYCIKILYYSSKNFLLFAICHKDIIRWESVIFWMKFSYNQHHATCNFPKTIDSWYQNCCMIVLNLSQIISGSAVCIAIFIYIQGGFETKRKISFKKMFNSRGPKIDPCGTFVVILSHLLKVLVTSTFYFCSSNNFSYISESLF